MGRRARKERVKSKKGRNGEESEEGIGIIHCMCST